MPRDAVGKRDRYDTQDQEHPSRPTNAPRAEENASTEGPGEESDHAQDERAPDGAHEVSNERDPLRQLKRPANQPDASESHARKSSHDPATVRNSWSGRSAPGRPNCRSISSGGIRTAPPILAARIVPSSMRR